MALWSTVKTLRLKCHVVPMMGSSFNVDFGKFWEEPDQSCAEDYGDEEEGDPEETGVTACQWIR